MSSNSRWASLDRRVRYLVVGGWNSIVAYLTFAACWYLLNAWMLPSLIVLLSYLLASVNGYLTFRYLVFSPSGRALGEYVRYQAVYLPILALNAVALPVALAMTTWNAYVLQLAFSVVAVALGYLGNRYFVFQLRR